MQPVLELAGIRKQFAGVARAARRAAAAVPGRDPCADGPERRGQVHADQGADRRAAVRRRRRCGWTAQAIQPASPLEAQKLGISTVYQEVNLCPNLSVAENMFAGRYPRRGAAEGFRIDWAAVNRRARELLARIGLDIDVTRLLSSYPVAVQQMVAIARALGVSSKVLILDEPTSSLDDDEVQQAVRGAAPAARRRPGDRLRHPLPEPGVCGVGPHHRAAQRRAGSANGAASELGPQALIAAMLGRELAAQSARPAAAAGRGRSTRPRCWRREGLGQTRPAAAGRPARARRRGRGPGRPAGRRAARSWRGCCSAWRRRTAGSCASTASRCASRAPPMRSRHGLALCPEERKTDGIVAELSLRENIALALQARLGAAPLPVARRAGRAGRALRRRRWASRRRAWRRRSACSRAATSRRPCIARWLATEPRLLILDEPTRGIDVAAKQEIMDADPAAGAGRHGGALHLVGDERGGARGASHRGAARPRARWASCPPAAAKTQSTN